MKAQYVAYSQIPVFAFSLWYITEWYLTNYLPHFIWQNHRNTWYVCVKYAFWFSSYIQFCGTFKANFTRLRNYILSQLPNYINKKRKSGKWQTAIEAILVFFVFGVSNSNSSPSITGVLIIFTFTLHTTTFNLETRAQPATYNVAWTERFLLLFKAGLIVTLNISVARTHKRLFTYNLFDRSMASKS